MKAAPPLEDGEVIVFDHVPSLRAFKRTALLMIALTIPAVIAFAAVFPDSFWPAVPLFVTCFILMQERFTLGRHRAWITNRRVIFQGGRMVALADITSAQLRANGVRLRVVGAEKPSRLSYPADGPALVRAVEAAKSTAKGGDAQ